MMNLSKDDNHVSTIVKIFCVIFLVCTIVVAFSSNVHDALDEWMKDLHHQIYTVVALASITTVSWIVWKIKK